jgi:1,4-alpha-glucan branching enzyme
LRPERQNVIAENQQIMSLKKQFLKSKPVCKVTFTVDPTLVEGAKEVAVLGDFNNWDPSETTMRKLNDAEADKFVYSGVAAEQNGIVAL